MAATVLTVENLHKSYGDRVLFDDLSMWIEEGAHVGLIARNGYGKSTLLNIILGKESRDAGTVTFRRDMSVGYLPQNPTFDGRKTVLDACFTGDSPALKAIAAYESALSRDNRDGLHTAIEQMDRLNAWSYEAKAKEILSRLHINQLEQTIDTLSGGELRRVALANALIAEPDMLILDEPTNHLDSEVVEWLESYLSSSNKTLLMVTHDRYFLDRVCTRIVEIEDKRGYAYEGNYAYYVEKRAERLASESARRQSDENLFRKEIEWMRRQPQARATKAKSRIDSFYELEERLKFRRQSSDVQLSGGAGYIGKKIFEAKGISKSFDDKVILRSFDYLFSRYEKMGIVGENGTGKSTFLKMLLGEVAPDEGAFDVGETVRFGYYSQKGMEFAPTDRVIDAITAVAEHIDLGDGHTVTASQFLQRFLFTPETQYSLISRLSGGEKRRLYLCRVLMRNPNFLILDEPTNDLDIATLQVLEDYLASFGGCLIVVSHDRYFMDKVVDHLLVFEGEGVVRDFPSSFSDFLDWKRLSKEASSPKVEQPKPDKQPRHQVAQPPKLTYKQKQELEQLEGQIPQLEAERTRIESAMSSGELSAEELQQESVRVGRIIEQIDQMTARWLELSEI